ncbi:MAG TPA: formyltransferase family protein, partial [Ignavibacteriales bacterium]|nr:formyltransferase family protein [Ignavibacteriales bacterium]
MLNLAIFVSGRGSNLKAILDSSACNEGKYCVKAVFSDKEQCGAFDIARACGIPTYTISKESREGVISHKELPSILQKLNIDLITLAGYLKKIPDEICSLYTNRMINIHPALLPAFG